VAAPRDSRKPCAPSHARASASACYRVSHGRLAPSAPSPPPPPLPTYSPRPRPNHTDRRRAERGGPARRHQRAQPGAGGPGGRNPGLQPRIGSGCGAAAAAAAASAVHGRRAVGPPPGLCSVPLTPDALAGVPPFPVLMQACHLPGAGPSSLGGAASGSIDDQLAERLGISPDAGDPTGVPPPPAAPASCTAAARVRARLPTPVDCCLLSWRVCCAVHPCRCCC
jgi:hypothetical protein